MLRSCPRLPRRVPPALVLFRLMAAAAAENARGTNPDGYRGEFVRLVRMAGTLRDSR